MSANAVPQRVVSRQSVLLRCLRIAEKYSQIDESETDSDTEKSDFEERSELVNRPRVTLSGRAVRAFVLLDV